MKGTFQPKNPKKYIGSYPIVYRSSWELKLAMRFDNDSNVIEWSSESVIVPYISPIDKKRHRYFVDFFVKIRNKYGKIDNLLIEVKPKKQTLPPEKKNITEMTKPKARRYVQEVVTYNINKAKWAAAEQYCANKDWKFVIMSEKDLGI